MAKTIILTGGGTAGHVIPNLALVPYLKNYFDEIHYIGSEKGLEGGLLAGYPDIRFHTIPCVKLERKLTPKNLAIPFKLMKGVSAAKKLIREIKPAVIFSKGGYVALPVALAAKGVPLISHESDMSIGLANKMTVKRSKFVCTSFSVTADGLENGIHTGAPIRQEIYFGDRQAALGEAGFSSGKPVLLVMGGSLGAAAVNECVYSVLDQLTALFNVIHIAGEKNVKQIEKPGYHQLGFTKKIENYFAAADFVVSRGGANALFELVALKKPTLVIPLPKGNSRGDQIENARYFESMGCVRVLLQEEMTGGTFLQELRRLTGDRDLVSHMETAGGIDGTRKIAKLLVDAASQSQS